MKIALCGKLRSGKDTVTDYLKENHEFTQYAFGDKLKATAFDLFPSRFENGKPRKLFQTYGQKMREIDPDVWVNATFLEINGSDIYGNKVISDLRQPNEYERCRVEGFIIVRVNCDETLRIERCKQSDNFRYQDLLHETEMNVDRFKVDYEIYNNGSVEELHQQIESILFFQKNFLKM